MDESVGMVTKNSSSQICSGPHQHIGSILAHTSYSGVDPKGGWGGGGGVGVREGRVPAPMQLPTL